MLFAVSRLADNFPIAMRFENSANTLAHNFVIVDDQDF
jgi:hypothetical protein